jgi:hypothetical protein
MRLFARSPLHTVAVSFAIILGFLNVGLSGLFAAEPNSHEKAVEAIERLSKLETIEGSYADMAVAASRLIDPALDDKALRRQIHEMAEAAANAWDAEDSPEGKVGALSRVVFQTYGLIQQPGGPKPLDMKQIVRLAEAIERLEPERPESLDTAALIHFKAGNVDRAREIIDRTVQLAEKYGTPSWVLSHFRKMQRQYRDAVADNDW